LNQKDNEIKRLHSQLGEVRAELFASDARFQHFIGKSKDGVMILDRQGVIKYANSSAGVILKQNIEKLIGVQFGILIEGDYESEINIFSKQTDPCIVELRVSVIEWDNEPYSLVFIHDITRRKLAETRLKTALEEKEILLQEVYHRVKNNLQIICSLLTLQEMNLKDPAAADALRESKNRVLAMSFIHDKLYQGADLAKISIGDYIQDLAAYLLKSYALAQEKVQLKIEVKETFMNFKTAIYLGLIVNELVTNSLKHAFPGERRGTIEVYLDRVKEEEEKNILIFRDDGVGMPGNVDLQCPDSLGMQVIHSMVKQLHGDIAIDRKQGTAFTIRFKKV